MGSVVRTVAEREFLGQVTSAFSVLHALGFLYTSQALERPTCPGEVPTMLSHPLDNPCSLSPLPPQGLASGRVPKPDLLGPLTK